MEVWYTGPLSFARTDRIPPGKFLAEVARNLPNSAGVRVSAVPPKSAKRVLIFGSASAALISLLSLSMISSGVFIGAPTPSRRGVKRVRGINSAARRVAIWRAAVLFCVGQDLEGFGNLPGLPGLELHQLASRV